METITTYRITETVIMNDFMLPTRSPESERQQPNSEAQDADAPSLEKNEGVR